MKNCGAGQETTIASTEVMLNVVDKLNTCIEEVNSVRDHLRELHSQLGIHTMVNKTMEGEDKKPIHGTSTLVEIIENMPEMIKLSTSKMHDMINEIRINLV